jgi:hypothetical protein
MTLIALLSLFPAANLNYEVNATALRTVVPALSQQSGIKLKVEDQLADEPVILRFVDVPLEEGLERLAKGVQAEWRVLPDGTRLLERSQRYTEQLEREIFARRVAYLEEVLAPSRKRLRKPFGPAEADKLAEEFGAFMRIDPARRTRNVPLAAQLQGLREQTPMYRLADTIALSFSAEDLASLPPYDEGKTYSTQPIGSHEPFPNFNPDWLDELQQDLELFRAALSRRQVDPRFANVQPELSAENLILAVQVNSYSITVSLRNPETGDWVGFGSLRLEDAPGFERRVKAAELAGKLDRRKQVQISQSTREISRKYASGGNNPFIQDLSPATVDMLLNPDRIDPLSHGYGEILLAWSKNEGVNLVAHLPDIPMGFLAFVSTDPVFPEQFFYLVDRQDRLIEDWDDGWLTMRCNDPLFAAEERVPRTILGDFSRSIHQKGYIGLAESSALALQTTPAQFSYAADAARPLTDSFIGESYEALRFFGLLAPQHRSNGNRSLTLNDLNSAQQEALWIAIGSPYPREGLLAQKTPDGLRTMAFLFPGGLPEGTRVNITVQESPAFYGEYKNDGGNTTRDSMSIEMIASIDAQHERADLFPSFANKMRIERLRSGQNYSFWAEIELGSNWAGQVILSEDRITGVPVSASDWLLSLTEEQRAQYQRVKNEMLEIYSKMTEAEIREQQESEWNAPPPPPPPQ